MIVDQVGTLVCLGPQERGVPLVCQALVDKESLERRALRDDQVSLEHLECLVGTGTDYDSCSRRGVKLNLLDNWTHTHTAHLEIHNMHCILQV